MYENATTLHLRPGMMEKALAILRERILPYWKEQPGLIRIALVPNPTNDRLTVISLWATAADAAAVEKKCVRTMQGLDSCLRSSAELPLEVLNPLGKLSLKIPLN